jgi:hypothetical protein
MKNTLLLLGVYSALLFGLIVATFGHVAYAQTTESGSIGLQGKINSAPPGTAPTIALPRDGSSITELPVTVSGICQTGLLIKIYKNNVFAGSGICTNGSYSIQIDLFSGRNELVARGFDDLDQASPDSNLVVVTLPISAATPPNRISLTSAFAKRGANPGETLSWPITLTGGNGPYAITVDWGDGTKSDVISQTFPGTFNITHVYENAGVYNIIIRAADKDGALAFLQLVGVANGTVGQNNTSGQASGSSGNASGNGGQGQQTKVLWQPTIATIPLLFVSFWLGKRYELFALRKLLSQGRDVS